MRNLVALEFLGRYSLLHELYLRKDGGMDLKTIILCSPQHSMLIIPHSSEYGATEK